MCMIPRSSKGRGNTQKQNKKRRRKAERMIAKRRKRTEKMALGKVQMTFFSWSDRAGKDQTRKRRSSKRGKV